MCHVPTLIKTFSSICSLNQNNLQIQPNGIMDCFDPFYTNDESKEVKVTLSSLESTPEILQTMRNGQDTKNHVMADYVKMKVKKDKNTYVSCSNVDQNV